jgi:hypothetical protein
MDVGHYSVGFDYEQEALLDCSAVQLGENPHCLTAQKI